MGVRDSQRQMRETVIPINLKKWVVENIYKSILTGKVQYQKIFVKNG